MKRDLPRAMLLIARTVLLTYLAAACSVSRYQSTTTIPAAGSAPIPHAFVHVFGGTTVYPLTDVIVVADSVVGFDDVTGARRAIPAASVSLVETRSADPVRTVGVIALVALGTFVVLGALLSYLVNHSHID